MHIMTFLVPNSSINREQTGAENFSFSEKMAMGLLPNINLIWGIKMLTALESKGTGLQWSTLWSRCSFYFYIFRCIALCRARPGDPLTMGSVWLMFLADIGLFSLIIAYVDKIAPGKFGVAEPWYFLFSPQYWTGRRNHTEV